MMRFIAVILMLLVLAPGSVAAAERGDTLLLGSRKAVITEVDSLPFVESEYTRLFRFDSFANPKLAELRERYQLRQIIAPGPDEFSQQVLLMDWVHNQFTKFGAPSTNARGALRILSAIEEGHTFFCSHYVHVMVSSAASLGWVSRPLALRRHQGVNKVGGSTEHAVMELWSNQHRKWIMFDPTSNMHITKAGLPLNAYEIRQEWFYSQGTNLVFVIGKEKAAYRKADLPIMLKHFAGFGDLAVHPDELDKYGFIGYIPNNDLLDSGEDYGQMFITKDALCAGTQWHTRKNPSDPARDPYFPLGQASLSLSVTNAQLLVTARTMTPNFSHFEASVDDGDWKPFDSAFLWPVRPGQNSVRVRTRNKFSISGPLSRIVVKVE